MVGDTLVVHNYGHGGSGWSLSWGSGAIAVGKAMQRSPREIAVIGCGALGLTSAILAQRAGAQVTIYCKELLQQARSARATGGWTPDSRIALDKEAGPQFGALWEQMARVSWKTWRSWLGLPGNPVCFSDRYVLSDVPFEQMSAASEQRNTMGFGEYQHLIADITPRPQVLPPGATPFPVAHVRRSETLQFNIHDYGHQLMTDFRLPAARSRSANSTPPGELAQLKEKVVIQLHRLWRPRFVEGRDHRAGARPDRLADPAAGSQLRLLLPRRLGAVAHRRHRGAGGRGRRPQGL